MANFENYNPVIMPPMVDAVMAYAVNFPDQYSKIKRAVISKLMKSPDWEPSYQEMCDFISNAAKE